MARANLPPNDFEKYARFRILSRKACIVFASLMSGRSAKGCRSEYLRRSRNREAAQRDAYAHGRSGAGAGGTGAGGGELSGNRQAFVGQVSGGIALMASHEKTFAM